MQDIYLVHHGVKGMRWGIRKQPETAGSIIKKKRTNLSINQYRRERKDKYLEFRNNDARYSKALSLENTNPKSSSYSRNYDRAQDLKTIVKKESNMKTTDYLVNKYGEKAIRDVEIKRKTKTIATLLLAEGGLIYLTTKL